MKFYKPGDPIPRSGRVQLSCGFSTCGWVSTIWELDETEPNAAWLARNKAMHEYRIHVRSHIPEPNTFFEGDA